MKKLNHIPVLLNEVIEIDSTCKDGWKIDCTLGGGGHFFALLKNTSKMIGFDADPKVIENITNLLQKEGFEITERKDEKTFFVNTQLEKQVVLINSNFTNFAKVCKELSINTVSLIIADLGLNMLQLKEEKRGFSFNDGKALLDMRLDPTKVAPTAADLVNGLGDKELVQLLRNFGEVGPAKQYAEKVKRYKQRKPIRTVEDLLIALELNRPFPGIKIHPATKVFMALRIAVNSEFDNLTNLLEQSLNFINNNAKVLIISFHSTEQKIVEQFAKEHLININKNKPSIEEIGRNSSSRSAILNTLFKND